MTFALWPWGVDKRSTCGSRRHHDVHGAYYSISKSRHASCIVSLCRDKDMCGNYRSDCRTLKWVLRLWTDTLESVL
jgi:hypothetical protein